MSTDATLKHLKSKRQIVRGSWPRRVYVHITVSGTITFRLDYRFNGRRETVVFGRYAPSDLSFGRARESASMPSGRSEKRLARHREEAREAPPEGGEELRRIWREMDEHGADGRQHAHHANVVGFSTIFMVSAMSVCPRNSASPLIMRDTLPGTGRVAGRLVMHRLPKCARNLKMGGLII
jgi:hypothetical protein